ncbi:tubulin folding cofactor D C terminal-domain-containing protein [Suillus subalutaceus]|uniref:tubulin folding cofactor D C terminal-domain-containing protein n=1 Tax=Suillus subalutaceus TaxID=48586 RepID=UPI001B86EB8E|nr:tubulin folding cofactor D C terminal-domain-containing protein [Suillus subalutaceus]KAG1872410.1 tubulin folding cofactor D C terminal-domain-containing protein [Suillus subalutaceus]
MDEDSQETRLFAAFERHDEFVAAQNILLAVDLFAEPSRGEEDVELDCSRKLIMIFGEYQEQSYLLDPYLESLVSPVAECLRKYAMTCVNARGAQSSHSGRVERLADLLHNYIKFRGFFPHEVADLSIALDFIQLPSGPVQDPSQWGLRYAVLLWLSLICRIPFDLQKFDDVTRSGETANAIELVGKDRLSMAGLEREGAATLLARFYARKDTKPQFFSFVEWSITVFRSSDIILSIGVLQVLCELVKSGSSEQLQAFTQQFLEITDTLEQSTTLASNTLVRKYRTKLLSRVALRLMPPNASRSKLTFRSLDGNIKNETGHGNVDEDVDVPEEIDTILESLFKSLQDKDTVVRWSAAKGIARLSERLPSDFSSQVFETILGLFSIHSIAGASVYDTPAIAEATWHGASLASAEMARRGLVQTSVLGSLLGWLSKALYFDIRKGSHSVGSNVRDAAAYVIWALARAQDPESFSPHARELAQWLVSVALFDREIHIRRAASAAFQEHVGRMALFPHGIDVLRKTDFYAVSVRRNAFTVAAPQVAEHLEYRSYLIDHIISITLRHWDVAMRELGAQALRRICELDLKTLGLECASKIAGFLHSVDVSDVHGALAALTGISEAYRAQGSEENASNRQKIFAFIAIVSQDAVMAPRNGLVLGAVCDLIASSLTLQEVELQEKSSVPHWKRVVDQGLRHRSSSVQQAAAAAMATTTLKHVEIASKHYPRSWRMYCLASPSVHLIAESMCGVIDALDSGLDDYTMDERGDVGSWVRMACIQGLASIFEDLFRISGSIPEFASYLPAQRYHSAIARILRQGVERLDNVRQIAGHCLLQLFRIPLPSVPHQEEWRIKGSQLMMKLFLDDASDAITSWSVGEWLFPKAVELLRVQEYRQPLLTGLIHSVGARTGSTHRPVSSSLVSFAQGLPLSPNDSGYSLFELCDDLIECAQGKTTSNAVVVPILQTFNMFLEADVLSHLSSVDSGPSILEKLLNIATRNVLRLKNVQRVQESMKIVVNLLVVSSVSKSSSERIIDFLSHPYPKVIRTSTAEYLYTFTQSRDLGWEADEAVEELLLETEWYSLGIVSPFFPQIADFITGLRKACK